LEPKIELGESVIYTIDVLTRNICAPSRTDPSTIIDPIRAMNLARDRIWDLVDSSVGGSILTIQVKILYSTEYPVWQAIRRKIRNER